MIVRNFGVRHGRRALAAPISRTCLRALSNSTTTTTTVADAPASPAPITTTQAFNAAKVAARQAELAQIPGNFREYQHQREATRTLGSSVESRYHPEQGLIDPPSDASLEMLMAAQCHMGHHISQWNPANQRYIYGERAGIHIISLETTATHLRRAARVVEQVAYYGGLILFVGNRKGHMPIVERAAELAKGCHLFHKWTPGTITNRDVMLANRELRIVDVRDQTLEGFEKHLRDRRPVVPDLVVCLNPKENHPLLYECGLANVPTIGIVDTDADPTWVTYQIPANDDSLRSVTLIAGILGRAGERGQARRLKAADHGTSTWVSPRDVANFLTSDSLEKLRNHRAAIAEAEADGILDGALARKEDFMTDDELLAQLNELPTAPPPTQ